MSLSRADELESPTRSADALRVLPPPQPTPPSPTDPAAFTRALVEGVERVVRGRRMAVEVLVCAALARGHVLIEDVPGSGKTTLAKAFAACVGAPFGRIQATADLLPADITGSGVWDPQAAAFQFVAGPLFAPVVLVDELNRTSPRSQSAFMEAMEEAAVSVDGVRHPLPDPFLVIATQNPLEQHGTFPLPEGQLDRFAVRLVLGPVDVDVERQIVREQLAGVRPEALTPVLDLAGVQALQRLSDEVHVSAAVLEYALAVARATRTDPRIVLGASTRAAIWMLRCARSRALLAGRDHVIPEDVQALSVPVLAHRLSLSETAVHDGAWASEDMGALTPRSMHQERVMVQVLRQVPVPVHR